MKKKVSLSKRARLVLSAIRKLLKYYQEGYRHQSLWSCPLCIAALCSECPWEVFEGDWCMEKSPHINRKREHPSPSWRRASIIRLNRWIKLIEDGTYDKKLRGAE
jgi:hypothetical protein